MRFDEAEERYRELEAKLLRGELTEDELLQQAAQLRVTDTTGRRWMISGRTGRWLMYDSRAWVFAEPSHERAEPQRLAEPAARPIATPAPPSAAARGDGSRLRWLGVVVLAMLLIGCVVGAGAAAWVLFLRGSDGETVALPGTTRVALVETYTPRPATPTYTPTPSPTPSRTPTASVTPVPTATSAPTETPVPTATPEPAAPTATPMPTSTSTTQPTLTSPPSPTMTPGAQVTHVVKSGETLSEIAAMYGVTVQALSAANGITNPALIRPGQVLVIPLPGVTPQTPTRTAAPTRTSVPVKTPTPKVTGTPKATATPRPKATSTPKPPALSGKIAFAVWNPMLGEGKYELFVSQIDGNGRNNLGAGFRQPQFRSDGNLMALNGDRNEVFEHLDVMNPAGGELREISEFSEDALPAWSPDGLRVVYSSAAWGDGRILLAIVNDTYGKQWTWIRYGNTELQGEYPFWLTDGRIVYHGCDFWAGGGSCGLYVVGAGGGNPQRITDDRSDTAPAGFQTRVTFMSARDDNWEIYVVNSDGSGLQRLTSNNAEDGLPTWSPDGKSIAFVSHRSGAWAIWVMNADGTSQRKLFDLGGGYGAGAFDWKTERISWAP